MWGVLAKEETGFLRYHFQPGFDYSVILDILLFLEKYMVKWKELIWLKKWGQNGWVQNGTVLGAIYPHWNGAVLVQILGAKLTLTSGPIRPCEGLIWKRLVPLWIFKWPKQLPQISAFLQTTPQKVADSVPRRAISVVYESFLSP